MQQKKAKWAATSLVVQWLDLYPNAQQGGGSGVIFLATDQAAWWHGACPGGNRCFSVQSTSWCEEGHNG